MKSVDRDAYYDLQDIFFCMFYVIELGISLDVPDLDPESYAGGTIPMLPSHLYDSQNKKNYWLGLFEFSTKPLFLLVFPSFTCFLLFETFWSVTLATGLLLCSVLQLV